MTPRSVKDIALALKTTEGGGVQIRRAFPTSRLEDLDPFLLFDHLGPLQFAPGEATGMPDHPHRGFETISYLLEGSLQHRDSFGHVGLLEPGDVQWMTAGSGLVHSEMPGPDLVQNGGRLQGFQIWVNLPKTRKMSAPHYQELKAAQIPVATSADGLSVARVVAGESNGVTGAVKTQTPVLYVHFTLQPGAEISQTIPSTQNAMAYIASGEARIEGRKAPEGTLAIFATDGDTVRIANQSTAPADVLVLAGEPIREPVARYGPFVMNTRDEIVQAFEDFRAGRMGQIEA
ncbi:MAG: pirin family protein [Bryobacteraceae bacterium]|nr:pirin family protein [Bryobacteraceae bacterium]